MRSPQQGIAPLIFATKVLTRLSQASALIFFIFTGVHRLFCQHLNRCCVLNAVPGQVCLHRLHRLQYGEPHLGDLLVRDEEGHTAGYQKVATTQAGLI